MITLYIGKPDTLPESETLDASVLGIPGIFETLNSVSLFGDAPTYRIVGLDSSDDIRSEFLKAVPEMSGASSDAFAVLEKLLAPERKKVEEFAKVLECKPKADRKPYDPGSAFVLANAFASGDRKKSWITFHQVTADDDEMEKTHGMVWWKLKDMMQKKGPFSDGQLKSMARSLVSVYHESRLGGLSMKERMEEFLLTVPEIRR